ncbi:MAG: DUF6732 family protein [Pseudomonadota bacterium]
MNRFFLTIVISVFGIHSAYAHVGHVGELAGHAHWIGVGALVAAAALAAILAKTKKQKSGDEETEVSSEEGELEGETA